jgi:hypothetical protein
VRAEVANRAGASLIHVEAPRHAEGGVHEPILQIAGAKMVDAPEAAILNDLAHQANGGDEAVVEATHVDDSSRLRRLPHLARLAGVHAERLLAQDVFAGVNSGHRRLEMQFVGGAVIEDLDGWILDDGAPVGDTFGVPIAARGGVHLLGIATADGDKGGMSWGRRVDIVERLEGVGVRFAHEGIAEHPDAQRGNLAVMRSSARHS